MGDKEKVIELNTLTVVTSDGIFDHFQRFIDFIGKKAFIDNVFNVDKHGHDVMRCAFFKKKMNVIEYILSFRQIRKKYMSDNDVLHKLCRTLNEFITNKEAVQYVVDTLGLTEEQLLELRASCATDIEKIVPFTK